jgi:large repetitive protein
LVVGVAPAITSGNSATFTVGTLGTFTVTATGSPSPTFSVTAGTLPTGVTLNATTGLLSGTPAAGTGAVYSITITAQNTVPPNATQSFTLTVNEAPAITSNNSATFTLGSNGTFRVTTSGNPTATLTETGSLPSAVTFVDNLDGTATISGIPATGTAGSYPITITALNGIGAGANQSFTLTVSAAIPCGSGSESLLNGQYTFALRGFDAIGPVSVGGIFNADGTGKVATLVGVEDINSTSSSGVQNLSINSASSSYKVGSDHRGCLTINTSAGTQIFRFSLGGISSGVASIGHIVEFDTTGSNTAGVLRLQTSAPFSTSSISGNYAFGASGPDVPSGKFAIVGMLDLSGGSVVTTGANPSVIDTNDTGNINVTGSSVYPTTPIALSAGGTYSITSNGRGALTLIVPGGSGSTVHVIVYAVSTKEFLMLPGDVQSLNGLYLGSAMQQSGGPFSTSSLNASSILYTTGLGNNGGTVVSRVSAGILTPSNGTFAFSGQQNNGGTVQAQSATAGTYAVAANGRVTFASGGGGSAPIIYLVSANKGFALFADTSTTSAHVESGFLEPQTGGPFSAASANGTYAFGSIQPDDVTLSIESGVVAFNGSTTQVNGTSDNNSSGTLNPGNTFGPMSYSVDSTGLGLIPAGCSVDGTTGQNGTCQNFFYMISPTRAVVVDATSSTTPVDPHLEVADQ